LSRRYVSPQNNQTRRKLSDIKIGLFSFSHNFSIVSVSESPDTIPQVYAARDVPAAEELGLAPNTTRGYTPSAIKSMNCISVEDCLTNWIERTPAGRGQRDPDDRWNTLFRRRQTGGYTPGGFARSSSIYPDGGDSITIEFQNGTTVRIPWFANVFGKWGNIICGADIFRRKCLTEMAILGNNTIVAPPPVSHGS
jgi:hypothetical protein